MKPAINQASIKARHAILASILAGTTVVSTGCSSGGFPMARMNPFARSAAADTGTSPTVRESIASTTTGAGNQVKAVAVGTKNAVGRTATAMTSVFRRKADETAETLDENDPLRLDNRPDKVDPEVFVANGQLWESTGDLSKAMESYTKALESSPKNGPALTAMARLHFRQNNLPKAAETFQLAIAQNPQDAGLYNDLGLTLSKMGNHTGAVSALDRALQLAPGTSRYANNLASVKFEAGDTTSAMQVLAANNKPAVAHFNMAYLHFKSGQMPQARTQLTEAMKFESQASGDVAVGRAIERSREMLAQINAGSGSIAQAAPQAGYVAGQYVSTAGKPMVQQTSQATPNGLSSPNVSTAASMGPAMSSITPPKPFTTSSTLASDPAPTGAQPSWSQAWNPNWQQTSPATASTAPATTTPATTTATQAAATTPSTPKPIRPASATPTQPTPTSTSPSSGGFTMPQ